MRARPLVHAAAACTVLALTGCQQPTPGVTVSSGTTSVHVESTTYCRDGQTPQKRDCVEHLGRVGKIYVKQGQIVGIDVDKTLAEHGWILVLSDLGERSDVQHQHYFSYTPDFTHSAVVNLEVRSLDHPGANARQTGVWKLQLVEQ